jgi:hypothetical protein
MKKKPIMNKKNGIAGVVVAKNVKRDQGEKLVRRLSKTIIQRKNVFPLEYDVLHSQTHCGNRLFHLRVQHGPRSGGIRKSLFP